MDKTKRTLLLVDDIQINLELLTDIFKGRYKILTACGGEAALDILREHTEIDLVLLDIIMPEMDGYQVLEIMKKDERLKFLPVIVITSSDDSDAEVRAIEMGAVDFISRPFNIKTVETRVNNVIRQHDLEKIKAENQRLRNEADTEKHLSALMENLPGGVAVIETDGSGACCTYFNHSVPSLFGLDGGEFLKLFEAEDTPEWIKTFAERSSREKRISFDFSVDAKNAEGAVYTQWIRLISSGLGESNGKKSMYCVFLDINVEKNQELRAYEADKRLKSSQAHIESLINDAPGGIVLCEENESGDVKTLFCSKGLSRIMGCQDYHKYLRDVSENPSARVVNPSDIAEFKRKFDSAASTGRTIEQLFCCCDYADNQLWIQLQGQVSKKENGRYSLYGFVTDITKEKEYERELKAGAYLDPLTGIYNRSSFFTNARRLIDEYPDIKYSVMRFNIGSFKLINDIMGRDTGDKVLITVAETIRSLAPEKCVYGRFFADSFAIIAPEGEIDPENLIDSVKKAIKSAELVSLDIQYYVGVYLIFDNNTKIDDMCDRALIACRSVTGSFNKHIAYYDDSMRLAMLEEREICDEAHKALANGEFCIFYQSVYSIKAKKFVSAEALVRWKHPVKGLISPGKFIPVFERNGLITELDLYILEQVCIYQQKRNRLGLPPFPVSVNISRMSLYNPNLFDIISDLTDRYGVDPRIFRIEITETAYNDNPAQLLETIGKLREKCYPILMDDFGSGYSSLNTLKDIPIDLLKLDMKFMQGFEKNSRVGTIVTSVARMSKWLNVPMLAEGVETKEQYDFLESIGCAYIQGYYFSKPICEEEFTKLIASEKIVPADSEIESYGISDDINEILGSNALASKLISGAFGGLGIYEMNNDKLEVIRVNEGYMQIMGHTPTDFNGEHYNVWEKMDPESVIASRKACLDTMHSDKPVRAVVHRYDKNGRLLCLEGIHRRLGGSDDNPIFCIAFNDITEQIENDRIIRQSKEQISNILDATGAVVVDIDFVGNTAFCAGNTDEYSFEVHELAEMIRSDRGFADITHPDERKKMLKFHHLKARRRTSADFRIQNISGNYIWCRFTKTQSFDENDNVIRLMGIIINIDAEKKAALELESTQEQIDVTMNNINVGILITEVSEDESVKEIYSNEEYWKLIGATRTKDFDPVAFVESKILKGRSASVRRKASIGEDAQFQYCLRREDGSEMWVDYALTPTRSPNPEKRRFIAILNDITEKRRTEYKINQLVSNFDCGLSLIARTGGEISMQYANDNFFEILNVSRSDEESLKKSLESIIAFEADNIDMDIADSEGRKRIVKIHRTKIDSGSSEENYVIVAEDVTLKRAEAKNRIAERKANALRGLYDEVFKLDYRNKTTLLVSCRNNPNKARNARPISLDYIMGEWTDVNIHPDDRERARALFSVPMTNPDFTDFYAEIRIGVPHTKGEYKTYGMVMVRSAADICMLFNRDMARIDNSTTSDEVAEINRLYRLVAEQTNTTIIEFDHISGKVTVSPSIYMYAAAMLTEDELVNKENYIKGLAIHPDDKKDFARFAEKIERSDKTETIILRMEMADKSFKWCRLSISTNKSNTGEILKSLCTINIVHEEVEARRKAESIDRLMRKTVKHIPVGMGIFRVANGIPVPVYLSDNIYTIFGIEGGKGGIDPRITEDFVSHNKLTAGAEGEYTQHCVRPDGSCFWLSTKYRVREENGNVLVYAALDDISSQMEARRSQEVQDQMYQLLLEEAGTVIFNYDNENDELFFFQPSNADNRKTESISGYSDNFNSFYILRPEDRIAFAEEIRQLSKKAASSELVVVINIDGYPRRFRSFFKSMEDGEGRVFRIIGKIEDVDEEMSRLDKIKAKAMYDSLCVDIYNKSTTEELIKAEIERNAAGALIMIDVDDFKSINDNLGHIFGDEFLKKFGTTVKSIFRDSDIVGRYGGDEFFVYLNHANAALAVKKSEQILEKVSEIMIPEIGCVKSSIGVTSVNPDNRVYLQIIKQADSALYAAKNRGKNQVVLFDPDTMSEGTYRTEASSEEGTGKGRTTLSSNPQNSASLILRTFSALYGSQDLSTGINQMLAMVGKAFDVSRAYIFEDTEDGKYCCNTFEWCNEGVAPEIDTLQQVSYEEDLGGNYRENMNDDGIFYCHDVSVLETSQREILERQNIKSVLQCAIMDNGVFRGFVGFDECRSNRFWTQGQIDALAFISKVLSIFLLKDRNRRLTENYAKSIKSILDNYPQYIYIVEKGTGKLLYLNVMAQKALGKNPIGEYCSEAICGQRNDELCPICVLNREGYSRPIDMLSPVLHKMIKAQAAEVEWEGRKAYLITCMVIDE